LSADCPMVLIVIRRQRVAASSGQELRNTALATPVLHVRNPAQRDDVRRTDCTSALKAQWLLHLLSLYREGAPVHTPRSLCFSMRSILLDEAGKHEGSVTLRSRMRQSSLCICLHAAARHALKPAPSPAPAARANTAPASCHATRCGPDNQ